MQVTKVLENCYITLLIVNTILHTIKFLKRVGLIYVLLTTTLKNTIDILRQEKKKQAFILASHNIKHKLWIIRAKLKMPVQSLTKRKLFNLPEPGFLICEILYLAGLLGRLNGIVLMKADSLTLGLELGLLGFNGLPFITAASFMLVCLSSLKRGIIMV